MIRRWLGGTALLLGTPLVAGACDAEVETAGTGAGSGSGNDDTVTVGPTATTSSASTSASTANTGGAGGGGEACLSITQDCSGGGSCCEGLSCDTTTLGEVCCSGHGGPCGTLNGEDCCGQLVCSAGKCLDYGEMPVLLAPFSCGEQWTYSHHDQEVRRALDFISVDGVTDGAPAIAAGWGYATQHVEDGGAGNYIVIDHGGDWVTYYFHLQSFSVPDGTFVNTGDEIGKVGTTGASSGPHLHHEQLFNGEGVDIVISGLPLAPYPSIYGIGAIVSNNCPMP